MAGRLPRLITFNGEARSISEWAMTLGIHKSTLLTRLNSPKWSLEEALTTRQGGRKIPRPKCRCFLTYKGRTQGLSEWAREKGIPVSTLACRLRLHGWSVEEAMERFLEGRSFRRHFITYKGKTQHLAAWGRELGIDASTLRFRLYNNWSVEKALSMPTTPKLADCCLLPPKELPDGVNRGYYIYDGDEELGEVYRLSHKFNCWTHSLVFNSLHPQYSQSWRNRWEALADLVKRVSVEEAA